jgi:beta-hydroxylase
MNLNFIKRKATRMVMVAVFSIRNRIERWIMKYSPHADDPFLATTTFPWIADLEENWRDIRAELDVLLLSPDQIPDIQQISVAEKFLTKDSLWKSFFFYGHGFKAESNCAKCPKTASLVANIPGMRMAMFSILYPGKKLPAHRGPYKGLLRYHLALKTSSKPEECGIRVGSEERYWVEGSSLLFDDSFEHEAWNNSDTVRVVLFVDIVRPLRPPARDLNNFILRAIARSPYVTNARRRQLAFDDALTGT